MENEAREVLREELLEFAREVVSSDRAGLVDAVEGLDERVERVLKATGGD